MSEQHHSGEQGHSEEAAQMFPTDFTPADIFNEMYADLENLNDLMTVSYTHLTLPTICSV